MTYIQNFYPMARIFRWFFYLIGMFVVLNVLGYVALQFYMPSILETLNRQLKQGINGDFQIGKLDLTIFEQFPNFSIAVSDIYLRGPKYSIYHKDFFQAEKIYVHVRPVDLFRGAINLKSISIKNGSIFIFRTSDGYTNSEVFKKKEKADSTAKKESALSLDLGNILFENTRFVFADTLKHKSFEATFVDTNIDFMPSDSSRHLILRGPMVFGGLMFNAEKGAYLSNTPTDANLDVEFEPTSKRLVIRDSELKFRKSTVGLSGRFDFEQPGHFVLLINSEKIEYSEGLSLVTTALSKKLSKFQFDTPVRLTVSVVGKLKPGDEPKIDVTFSSVKNRFSAGKIEVKDFAFDGSFMNHIDSTKDPNDNNSRITIDNFSGSVSGIPTGGKLMISDLTDPNLSLETESKFGLRSLNQQTDTTKFRFLSGDVDAKIRYNGKLKEYLDPTNTVYHGKLTGDVQVKNGSLDMILQQKKLDQANIQIHFTEKQVNLDKINFKINKSPVQMKGKVTGFVPFFFQPEKKGYVNLTLYSPKIDLSTLIKKKIKRAQTVAQIKNKKVSDVFEALYNKVEFDLSLKVDEIVNGSFRGQDLSGKFSLVNDKFSAGPVKMKTAGGQALFSMKMSDLDKDLSPLELKAEVKDADIKEFFTSFNNFSQSTITADNLNGRFSTNVQLNAMVDDQYKIQMPTVKGDVDFKIKDGRIQDFEPLQKMSNFLFKKRDFTDVQFAEITSHFHISGKSLDISRMEIQSSVLTLFLEGRYSLADSTDLSIQIPVSNLKKRNKDYQPENVGVDAKVGPSVFLHASKGKDGKTAITYDPFKKFKGKKK